MRCKFHLGKQGYHFYFGSYTSSPYYSLQLAEEAFEIWANPSNPEYQKALEEAQK
jgi:hypothetical protein